MAVLSIEQKKEWARESYFRDNLTQKEVAEKVGLSRQTINKMAIAEKWEERKAGITLTREEQVKHLYRQVKEINEAIAGRDKGQRFATTNEADILIKLSSAIKKLETEAGIADIISVGTRFIDFLRTIDLERAKDTTQLFDAFIRTVL